MPLRGAAAAGRVARCAVRAHHKRHTNTKKSQLRQRHSAATQPPPTATTAPVPFPRHRRSNKHLASRPASHCCTPPQDQGRKIPPTTGTTSRTTAPTNRGPRRWGGHPATPPASPGHPPTRKTDFLLALPFPARHAALLVVLAVQLALVVVVGAAHATAPVVGLWWVPGLVSRLDGQHKALGEAHLLCRGRQARAGEPPRGSVSRPARSTRS